MKLMSAKLVNGFGLITASLGMVTATADTSNVERLIGTLGFPIVVCGITMYINWKQNEQHREDMKELNKQYADKIQSITDRHKEEVDKLSGALENNTIAMQKLVAVLDQRGVDL